MSIRLLVFAVLVSILGSLSTFGEEGSISNETDPIIVKVKSQSVDVESNSRQSHLNCNEKVKIKKAGKGTYICTLDIDYSLSPPICLKSTAKWNRPYKKSTTFAIETADAVLTVSVLKNKVKSCKIERLTTATTTSTLSTPSSKTTSKSSSERLTTATTTSTPTTPSSKTTSKPSSERLTTVTTTSTLTTSSFKTTSKSSSERLTTATTTSTPTTPSSITTSIPSSGSYEDAVLEELELSTAFANMSLGEEDQHNCKKELKTSIKMCQKSEETIEKLRFKKPFVRSTELTDRLGRDSRLYNALKETITRVSSNWTSVGEGESLIEFVSQNFLKWTEKGGGISTLEPKSRSLTRSTKSESKDEDMKCAPFLLVRRIDGKCNNLVNKHQGSAGTALKRFFNNSYEDGESIPRGGFHPSSLPSARVVSTQIHHYPGHPSPSPLTTKGITHMVMQFGQFLDHDISLTADNEMDCCAPQVENNGSLCFNIDITGDDFYEKRGRTCHSLSRSVEIVTDTKVREQMNGITAYIDASNVYGSNDSLARNLRTMVDGKLLIHNDGPMLPTRKQATLESHPPALLDDDLVAGDVRAIEHSTLASIHSLFLNEHNRIAEELKARLSNIRFTKKPYEQDEIIYQESRKIVGAQMQNIVYNEFLPTVLSEDELTKYHLRLSNVTKYNDTIDSSVRNEFATVAFRFGHSLIAGTFNGNGGRSLRDSFFDIEPEFVSGSPPNNDGTAWHSELEECAKQKSPADDVFCTEDITNFLFSKTRGAATHFGDDLPARNIQRGRDHGLPPYNEFRTFCGLDPLKDFDTKPDEITLENWAKLSDTYDNVNDIDAWTGGLAETAPSDALVGPTFGCIIGQQFNFLKFGDRFFFNNDNGYGLKINSRETVRQRTLGDIMCDNTNIITLPKYVMKEEDEVNNPQQACSSRNALDFDAIAKEITVNEFVETLAIRVSELEASNEMLKAALASKCDSSTCETNMAALDNTQATVTEIETCLGDVSSSNCPLSPTGKTGLAAALADKCEVSTCNALYSQVFCPAGWTWLATGCYKFIGKGTHQEAISNCENKGGFLTDVGSQEELDTVVQFYKREEISDLGVWLGATDEIKEGEWIWSHSGKILTFAPWDTDKSEPEPNGGTSENCLELNADDAKFSDLDCTEIRTGLCEFGSCPARWTSLATGCYKFSGVGNYQEAINNCKNEGGFLIEVDDVEEMRAVKQFYKDEGISVDSVWLGATDEAKEREWIWSHSGKKMNFHAWWGGGAPFGRTHANCLALYASRDFKWYDISCTLTRTALCEFDAREASGSFLTRGGEDESSWIIG